MTNDNGGEFRFKEKEPYDVFWCEPHKPQQRGTIENTIVAILNEATASNMGDSDPIQNYFLFFIFYLYPCIESHNLHFPSYFYS